MRGAVEALPVGGVLQPEVGTHVDDEDVRAELLGDGGGLPVRQREEDDVVSGEDLGGGFLEDATGERQQVRLQCAEFLSGVGVAGQSTDLDLGVSQEQTQQFPTRVPTRSGHRRTYRHGTLLFDGMTIRFAARLCNPSEWVCTQTAVPERFAWPLSALVGPVGRRRWPAG